VTDETLEPGLTKADKRVLAAVPSGDRDLRPRNEQGGTVTAWQIGEALNDLDVRDIWLTLRGLAQLGYAFDCGGSHWWRTRKGDEAIA
jgi:hypothetical protein